MLVGVLAASAVLLVVSLRADDRVAAVRFAFRTILIGAIPAYLVMRVGAEWIADKENLVDSDAAWIGIGYGIADGGLLVLIVDDRAGRPRRRGGRAAAASPRGLVRWTYGLTLLLIAAYAVALWAMVTKPPRAAAVERRPQELPARSRRRSAGLRTGASDRRPTAAGARAAPARLDPDRARDRVDQAAAHDLQAPAAGALALRSGR